LRGGNTGLSLDHVRISWRFLQAKVCLTRSAGKDHLQRNTQIWSKGGFWFRTS